VPWADDAKQQLSRLALSGCELSADVRILGAGLLQAPSTDPQRYSKSVRWQNKQAAPCLCASVRAVTWADEAEQHLSRLALYACELSADVRILRAELAEEPGTKHLSYI